jgi:hypothetical protein
MWPAALRLARTPMCRSRACSELTASNPKGLGKGRGPKGPILHAPDRLVTARYVAILELRKLGFTVDQAAAEVAVRLGKKTANEIDAIRTGFYKFHPPFSPDPLLASWEYCFIS